MIYEYDLGLIKENIAPTEATSIGVYDQNGEKKLNIKLGRL
jgi:hypothetical protein